MTSESTTPRTLPTLNGPAPNFTANTTHGPKSLSDYKGKWLVLFSHPADFTPVCTTELVAFARHHPDFQKLNCELLGLSIDSVFSHIAWIRNMEEKFDVKIPYPLVADLDMKVAQAYGMIHPGASETATVRCVFVIDDKQVVRAMIYYPMTNGRSVDEILRLVTSLQTADKNACATPEGWTPGKQVVVPPPKTIDAAAARMQEKGIERKDWYLSTRQL
jgi:peroxiredoxin (alkyl hydroperoxide reductase subunit C)